MFGRLVRDPTSSSTRRSVSIPDLLIPIASRHAPATLGLILHPRVLRLVTGSTGDGWTKQLERGIRTAILAVLVEGMRRRDPGTVVNAVVALVGTCLPTVLERAFDVEFRPWQRVYAATAMLTHAVGMLGLYEDTAWWDHLTHTHSATLAGGIVHVVARRRGRNPRRSVVSGVVLAGVSWEVLEYAIHGVARRLDVEPILVPYGAHDTLFDVAFDLLGACLVLVFGDRLLDNLT